MSFFNSNGIVVTTFYKIACLKSVLGRSAALDFIFLSLAFQSLVFRKNILVPIARLSSVATAAILLPFFLLLSMGASSVQGSTFLEENAIYLQESKASLLSYKWQYWVNKENLTAEQILTAENLPWVIESRDNVNHAFDSEEYWFRFRVAAQEGALQGKPYIIEISYPLLDEIEVFQLEEGKVIRKHLTGDKYPFSQRPIQHRYYLFPFTPSSTSIDFYIRVKTNSTVQLPLSIWPAEKFWEQDNILTYLDGLIFGGILIMLLYNFFVYLNLNDRSYLYYILFMVGIASTQACLLGVGYQFVWPDDPVIQDNILIPSIAGSMFFAALFFNKVFDLKRNSRIGYYSAIFGGAVSFVIALGQLFLPYSVLVSLIATVLAFISITWVVIAVHLWITVDRQTGFFIVGLGLVCSAFCVFAASSFGLIPRTLFIEYIVLLSFIIEIILFSFALAYKLNLEQKILVNTQKALLESQLEINHKLDIRVKQKTQELEVINAKLQNMVLTDRLTDVKNRRFFDERSVIDYKTAYREQKSLAILLIDIDNFKSINDKHGHLVGDECLAQVAGCLKQHIKRSADSVSRYGGEEFVVLLPGATREGAFIVAEKMRQSVESIAYTTKDGELLTLTISIGLVAYVPKLRDGRDHFIQLADEQMYLAKADGKNCIKCREIEC